MILCLFGYTARYLTVSYEGILQVLDIISLQISFHKLIDLFKEGMYSVPQIYFN